MWRDLGKLIVAKGFKITQSGHTLLGRFDQRECFFNFRWSDITTKNIAIILFQI